MSPFYHSFPLCERPPRLSPNNYDDTHHDYVFVHLDVDTADDNADANDAADSITLPIKMTTPLTMMPPACDDGRWLMVIPPRSR